MHKNITQGKMAIKLISGTTCYALTYIEFWSSENCQVSKWKSK